jgi:hypothetical protein
MSFLTTSAIMPAPVICGIPISHRDKIIKDLARKNPLGPLADLSIYESKPCYRSAFYHNYSAAILFQMGIRDIERLREVTSSIFYPNLSLDEIRQQKKTGTITKYINRIWPLIRSAIIDTRISGSLGIYEVYDYKSRTILGGIVGYVYANDLKMAKVLGQMILGFITNNEKLSIRYVEYGTKETVEILNISLMSKLAENRKIFVNRKNILKEKIENIATHIDLLTSIVGED